MTSIPGIAQGLYIQPRMAGGDRLQPWLVMNVCQLPSSFSGGTMSTCPNSIQAPCHVVASKSSYTILNHTQFDHSGGRRPKRNKTHFHWMLQEPTRASSHPANALQPAWPRSSFILLFHHPNLQSSHQLPLSDQFRPLLARSCPVKQISLSSPLPCVLTTRTNVEHSCLTWSAY